MAKRHNYGGAFVFNKDMVLFQTQTNKSDFFFFLSEQCSRCTCLECQKTPKIRGSMLLFITLSGNTRSGLGKLVKIV